MASPGAQPGPAQPEALHTICRDCWARVEIRGAFGNKRNGPGRGHALPQWLCRCVAWRGVAPMDPVGAGPGRSPPGSAANEEALGVQGQFNNTVWMLLSHFAALRTPFFHFHSALRSACSACSACEQRAHCYSAQHSSQRTCQYAGSSLWMFSFLTG